MPRVQVYLPDDLHRALKERGLPASELLQAAVRAELARRDALAALDEHIAELIDDVGEPTAEDVARAAALVERIQDQARPKG